MAATLALSSCGARSGLGDASVTDGAPASSVDASPADTGATDASWNYADSGGGPDRSLPADSAPSSDATADDAPACAQDPCLTAPLLAAGGSASGTTCGVVEPPGCPCSTGSPMAFYRLEVAPNSELNVTLSPNLFYGLLCNCPEKNGCCVGPSGWGGNGPDGFSVPNTSSTPLVVHLAVSRHDVPCGSYLISLGP